MSADGTETQEVTVEGSHQEMVQIEEGDAVSRVIKRTVLRSEGDQKEVWPLSTVCSHCAAESRSEVCTETDEADGESLHVADQLMGHVIFSTASQTFQTSWFGFYCWFSEQYFCSS